MNIEKSLSFTICLFLRKYDKFQSYREIESTHEFEFEGVNDEKKNNGSGSYINAYNDIYGNVCFASSVIL